MQRPLIMKRGKWHQMLSRNFTVLRVTFIHYAGLRYVNSHSPGEALLKKFQLILLLDSSMSVTVPKFFVLQFMRLAHLIGYGSAIERTPANR